MILRFSLGPSSPRECGGGPSQAPDRKLQSARAISTSSTSDDSVSSLQSIALIHQLAQMEAVLITRHTPPATDTDSYAPATTSDLRLTVELQCRHFSDPVMRPATRADNDVPAFSAAKPSNDRLVNQLSVTLLDPTPRPSRVGKAAPAAPCRSTQPGQLGRGEGPVVFVADFACLSSLITRPPSEWAGSASAGNHPGVAQAQESNDHSQDPYVPRPLCQRASRVTIICLLTEANS